jgi:prefoldin subunit 5
MIKNLMAGAICLFCMNMLFNKAAVNRLEREIEELTKTSIRLQDSIEWKANRMDSLEQILHEINTNE